MKRFPSPGALTGGLLTLALLPVSWPSGALAQEVEACTDEATDLIADQTTVVGDVNVCNVADTLTVTYEPSSPWCLVSTALHVAASEDDIPQTMNGNPKPGQFADGDDYDPCVDTDTFEFLLEDIGVSLGDTVVIAANARVLNMDTGAEEGAWGDGTRFVERGNWAMHFTYEMEERGCPCADNIAQTLQELEADGAGVAVAGLSGSSYFVDGSCDPEGRFGLIESELTIVRSNHRLINQMKWRGPVRSVPGRIRSATPITRIARYR